MISQRFATNSLPRPQNSSTRYEGGVEEDIKNDIHKAAKLFGSGWVWLVEDNGALRIISTANADSPVGTASVPLLVLDVWEHAYYVDYRNDRKQYVETFLDELINWKFAASNLVDKHDSDRNAA